MDWSDLRAWAVSPAVTFGEAVGPLQAQGRQDVLAGTGALKTMEEDGTLSSFGDAQRRRIVAAMGGATRTVGLAALGVAREFAQDQVEGSHRATSCGKYWTGGACMKGLSLDILNIVGPFVAMAVLSSQSRTDAILAPGPMQG